MIKAKRTMAVMADSDIMMRLGECW